MKCNDFQQKLSDYIEGIIPFEERMIIEEHLKSCSTCNESLADMKRTMGYVHDLEDIEPPAWLREKIMSRIKTETEPKRGFFQKLFYPLHIKLPIEAVVIALITVITIYIFKTMQPEMKLAQAPSEHETVIARSPSKVDDEAISKKKIASPLARNDRKRLLPSYTPLEKTIPSSPPLKNGREGGFQAWQTMLSEKPAIKYKLGKYAQVATPSQKQNEVIPSAGAPDKDELKTEASSSSGEAIVSAERRKSVMISLRVKDVETAREEIEETLIKLDGKIIGTQFIENNEMLVAEIDSHNLKGLFANLKRVGHVTKREADLREFDGKIDLTIKILKQ